MNKPLMVRISATKTVQAHTRPTATYRWGVTLDAAELLPNYWFRTRAQAETYLRNCNCDVLRAAISRLGI